MNRSAYALSDFWIILWRACCRDCACSIHCWDICWYVSCRFRANAIHCSEACWRACPVALPLLLRLLGGVEWRGIQQLNVAAHLLLHHLLEGLLLPRELISHGLHRGHPPAGHLIRRLLPPAHVIAHVPFPII